MEYLKKILKDPYGGRSISFEDGQFILYEWTDAPVDVKILVSDPDFAAFLRKVKKWPST